MCSHMRWDNLKVDAEDERTLPGYREPATVRTFDAPEALDTRFYEVRAKSALNKVPDASRMPFRWTINPYRGCAHACAYCFARPTHTYLDFDAGRDFEKEIVVKVNVPEVARAELMRPSWKREHVALGTNTDPYQWVEGRYRLMPGIWEAMRDSGTPSSVLTKSPLLLRDLALMKEVHSAGGFAANLSIPPLMPGINDAPEQVEKILELCGEAGAVNIGGIPLHLRGEVRDIFFEWLNSYRPELVTRYEQLYARGAYVGKEDRERIE